ncbi:MAG TPA: tetratricopeptide repeat protein, partial [Phycisphaerae bacterium]|nr:tetratricopeptide repeat protein [Phycisphaerae bacterium]
MSALAKNPDSAGRRSGTAVVLGFVVALAGCLAAGCAGPRLTPDSPEARLFGPLPRPSTFNLQRAMLPLAQVPDGPSAPGRPQRAGGVELPRQALQRLEEARRLFAEQRFTETIGELNTALRYHADIHEAHQMLALASMFAGDTRQARVHAERAIELKPDDLPCHYVLGRLAEQAGGRAEAIRRYRTALLCEVPASFASYRALVGYHLGLLLEQEGYFAAAAEQLAAFQQAATEATAEGAPENPELASVIRVHLGAAMLTLARCQGLLERYAAAADALAAAVKLSPKDGALRSEWICMLGRAGRWPEAQKAVAHFVDDTGADKEAVELMLAAYRAAGRPGDAANAIESLVARYPDNVDLNLCYVDALLAADRVNRATEVLAEVSARNPDRPEVRLKLIALSRARGDWEIWLETLARELVDRPGNLTEVEAELGRVSAAVAESFLAQRLGRADGVIPAPQRLPGVQGPARAGMDYLLARLAHRVGKKEDAGGLLEESAKQLPGFAPTAMALAQLRIEAFRWSEALGFLEGVKSAGQNDAGYQRLLGQCHEGLDQIRQAIEHYNKVIQLNPSDVATLMQLARLYERLGDPRQAGRQYEAIVAVDDSNLLAREGIIRTLWSAGDQSQMMRLVDLIGQMQRLDANAPATQRCLALIKLLQPPHPDLTAYVASIRDLVAAFPDDLRSREELGGALIAMRKYAEAVPEIDEILKRDPFSERAAEMRTLVLMRQLDFEGAARQLERMLGWYPNRSAWLADLAQLRMVDRVYDEAIGIWSRLIELSSREEKQGPGHSTMVYRAKLMHVYRQARRFDEARELAERWLSQTPDPRKSPENEAIRDQLRWFVLTADAAAEDTDRYLSRIRQW